MLVSHKRKSYLTYPHHVLQQLLKGTKEPNLSGFFQKKIDLLYIISLLEGIHGNIV